MQRRAATTSRRASPRGPSNGDHLLDCVVGGCSTASIALWPWDWVVLYKVFLGFCGFAGLLIEHFRWIPH